MTVFFGVFAVLWTLIGLATQHFDEHNYAANRFAVLMVFVCLGFWAVLRKLDEKWPK